MLTYHADNSRRHRDATGFTIIEILIVVAIIVALIAILVPSLGRVKTIAQVTAAKTELGAIRQGLQTYYEECKMFPSSVPPVVTGWPGAGRGSAMLAEGLMGYLPGALDGAGPDLNPGDGPYGFRKTKTGATMGGAVLGPWMQSDPKVFKTFSASDQFFVDPWGNEILYYRAQAQTAAKVFDLASKNDSIFATDDCAKLAGGTNTPDPALALKFLPLLGANSNNTPNAITTGADSYLLISAGPDGIYFTADDVVMGRN